ncbi:hypothetical protein TruAng_001636 [Truncatella angustata]|nr:hypothetical protein TruAng_001636 [Truncatella angustata]
MADTPSKKACSDGKDTLTTTPPRDISSRRDSTASRISQNSIGSFVMVHLPYTDPNMGFSPGCPQLTNPGYPDGYFSEVENKPPAHQKTETQPRPVQDEAQAANVDKSQLRVRFLQPTSTAEEGHGTATRARKPTSRPASSAHAHLEEA